MKFSMKNFAVYPGPPALRKTYFPARPIAALCSILCAVFLLSASCSGNVAGALKQDGSAEIEVEIVLGKQMAGRLKMINSIMRAADSQDTESLLLDGPAIALSMADAPGISAVSLRNTGPSAIAGTISVSRVDSFLSLPAAVGMPFIRYDPAGRIVISLDMKTSPALLSLLSADVRDYLSTLAAPVATGMPLSKTAYREIVASLHGPKIADEIAAAIIPISIEFPRPVKEVKGGEVRGRSARFALPLMDLLVLEQPLIYEVAW